MNQNPPSNPSNRLRGDEERNGKRRVQRELRDVSDGGRARANVAHHGKLKDDGGNDGQQRRGNHLALAEKW